jgi:hypothetical protein
MQYLESCNIATEKSVGKQSFWDVKGEISFENTLDQIVFFEVKFDLMSSSTGNLAIEFWNPKSNKESGILITRSDFWIFAFNNPIELWICEVSFLKEYMNENKAKRIVNVAGDRNASLALYCRDKLCDEVFIRIDNMEKEEFRAIIKGYVNKRGNDYIHPCLEN